MIRATETYIVSFDITGGDVSIAMTARQIGSRLDIVHTLTDEKAEELYKILSNKNISKEDE